MGEKRPMRILGRVLLLLCVGLGGVIMLFEEKFIYFPEKYPLGMWEVGKIRAGEGQVVPKVEDAWFTTEDGVRLHGWFCVPHRVEGGAAVPVSTELLLLFFHGNAGNITYRYDMIRMLMAIPVDVFIADYRGYGRSEGHPSEEGLYRDARGAWNHLVLERRIPPERVVLLGKSLGGAVAIDLATRVRPAGLIVQSSFTSVPDMASALMPFFPKFLLRTQMDSLRKIPEVACPKLFIHSPADEIVPYRLGRRLFEAASESKRFYEVPGAPHNETYLVGGEAYLEAIRVFIRSCAHTG
jgi:hypothetical protein